MFSQHLWTRDLPDPDLMIRTSNEQRISNFLLWQSAYTEFVFTDDYWPEFGRDGLEKAIAEFNRRERRFGAIADRLLSGDTRPDQPVPSTRAGNLALRIISALVLGLWR